jgi:hypothetical protein
MNLAIQPWAGMSSEKCTLRTKVVALPGVTRIGVVLPIAVDLPGHDEPMRRLPDPHVAPVAFGAVDATFILSSPDPPFQHSFCEVGPADVILRRPPRVERLREELEGAFNRQLNRPRARERWQWRLGAHECPVLRSPAASLAAR